MPLACLNNMPPEIIIEIFEWILRKVSEKYETRIQKVPRLRQITFVQDDLSEVQWEELRKAAGSHQRQDVEGIGPVRLF